MREVTSKETNKSQPSANLPPPPPQLPTDLGLKQILDLKKKRSSEALEEGEVGPQKGKKQQKMADNRGRRSPSVESRDESLGAEVRQPPRVWSPRLEVDGATIPWDASVCNF